MRERLADRRPIELFDFESVGLKFTAGIGRYPDGRLAEIFCDNHKADSTVGTLVRDAAIILSFAIQHGADAESIRRALCRDSAGRALGPLGEILDRVLKHERADT
jgi:ribonucleoside-diphosphate reductase alpha chain